VTSWNSEGEKGGRGVLELETAGKGGRGNTVWNSEHVRGVSALNFQRGKTGKASLEIVDLITFPVCTSSNTN